MASLIGSVRNGDVHNMAAGFREKYLTEDDGLVPLHMTCVSGNLDMVKSLCNTGNIETCDKYNYRPIHVACICGHLGIVEYLHQHGCDIEAPGNSGNRPLHLASKHGWLDVVKYLCNQQCQLDAPNYNLWRPIHLACRDGHTEIVRHLCEQGCDKEVFTNRGERPLHLACIHGHMEIVRFLCEQNCNIEVSTSDNYKPLQLVCMHGHIAIVDYICEEKINIISDIGTQHETHLPITEDEGNTLLYMTCDVGNWNRVTLLCNTGNIETCDKYNYRPIHVACICGHLGIVEYLHQHGCDIEAPEIFGNGPLHLASEYGRLDVVKYLCNQHCQLDDPINSWRPIHFACRNGHAEIVRHLCEQGCDKEVCTDFSERPIHLACMHGHLEVVRVLCEKNCDIETSTWDHYRPLHLACLNGHLEVVRFLCEQNCDIEASTSDNDTALHLACRHGHVDIVEYLCEKKCNIEVLAMFKYRPIHVAVLNGHIDIVRYLYQQRCDLEAVTKFGESVLDLAIQKRRHDIHKFLSDEISKRQLIKKISNMKVECDVPCDHSSCFQGIYSTKFLIGRGGFGGVFKMKDPGLDYTFCMKSIYLDPNASNQKTKHIEFNINKYLHALHHERIVQYFGMINVDHEMLIFMEYVKGMSLDNHINKKPLPHDKVIQYSKEILEGLKFLHRNKIIHRDIKPQNIMLTAEKHVKLCDFGLSCYLESIGQRSQIHTAHSSTKMTFCGTPNYMAPELVRGHKYSYPVDIWGLGASVVEMLTGVRPFHGMGYCAIIFHIGTIQKIEFVPAQPISADMKSFVDQMLCPSPSSRATAEKLLGLTDVLLAITPSSSRKET